MTSKVSKKRVSIYSDRTLTSLPVRTGGTILNQVFNVQQILGCLQEGATVYEVFDNGQTAKLNLENYDIDLVKHPDMIKTDSQLFAPKVMHDNVQMDYNKIQQKQNKAMESHIKEIKENPFEKTTAEVVEEEFKKSVEENKKNEETAKKEEVKVDVNESESETKLENDAIEEGGKEMNLENTKVLNEPGMIFNESQIEQIEKAQNEKKEEGQQGKRRDKNIKVKNR